MRKSWLTKVKKLAFAYGTGWEYMPGSEEAGSVLTDIFLEMAEENREHYEMLWKKHEMTFLQTVPGRREETEALVGALAVQASGGEHGKWMEEGTAAYMLQEQGAPIRFQTTRSLRLTSARLQYAIYCRGLCAWLSYEAEEEGAKPLAMFQPEGRELSHPVFRWYFQGLCDGREHFCFAVEFHRAVCPATALSGKWTISDGENIFPADWRQAEDVFLLEGRTPEFKENLEGEVYQVCLELSPREELTEDWLETLREGFALTEAPKESAPDLCLTDISAGEGERVLPFGDSPEEAACCYFACDRVMAGEEHEIELRFRESFLTEEKLPELHSGEYEKLYKKYSWLQQIETVREWKAEATQWEYFNGNLWCNLPGSEAWNTGCRAEDAGEKIYRWKRPRDMKPCPVEGENHFYIRLRLCRVSNAYALYYRKAVPVLEDIRFAAGKRRMFPVGQTIPDLREAREEKMYLGFDREVTSDNCWYTGKSSCSFEQRMLRGRSVRFGREAFWVELTEKSWETSTCFVPNFVPVRQLTEEAGEGTEIQAGAGTVFYLEPRNMGVLEAVSISDIRYDRTGAPVLLERQAGENYFAHFGRVLTLMDMELMLQERYPLLRVKSCTFRREKAVLEIILTFLEPPKDRAVMRLTKQSAEEMQNRLPEISSWLEKLMSEEGPLWLQNCSVSCSLPEQYEQGGNVENAGTNITG